MKQQLASAAAVALFALTSLTPALAQDMSLADLETDPALATAFERMAEGQDIPDWVMGNAVTSPAGKAAFDGREYEVLTGCKKDDCAANQIALLYHQESGDMYGLIVTTEVGEDMAGSGAGDQHLRWLNIGGNAESIDGRSILYAATTGSLDNHPDAFDYR